MGRVRLIGNVWVIVIVTVMLLLIGALQAVAQPIVLSKPGQSSLEWLLIDHAGAKELRGGKECHECHGEGLFEAVRQADLSVRVEKRHVVIDLVIALDSGDKPTADFAFLLGSNKERSFSRVGCWATCHSDMRHMDNDIGLGKYLASTRKKMLRSGGGEEIKPKSDLNMLRYQGRYLEMWQVRVLRGKVQTLWQEDLLERSKRLNMGTLQATTRMEEGKLRLIIKRPVKVAENLIYFQKGQRYTVAMALLSDEAPLPAIEVEIPSTEESDDKGKQSKKNKKGKDKGTKKETKSADGEGAEEGGEDQLLTLHSTVGPQHWVSFPVNFTVE